MSDDTLRQAIQALNDDPNATDYIPNDQLIVWLSELLNAQQDYTRLNAACSAEHEARVEAEGLVEILRQRPCIETGEPPKDGTVFYEVGSRAWRRSKEIHAWMVQLNHGGWHSTMDRPLLWTREPLSGGE